MARRRLLTGEQWAKFQAVPTDERELIRHYTLGRDDLDAIATKRTARSRLGYAVLLCYLRHPGRVPDPDEMPPPALLAFVAHQVGAEPDDYADYRRRGQTRREQMAEIMAQTGHRSFDRAAFTELASWLLSIAQVNRDPMALATALVDELRRRRILLPSAAVLELVLHHARGRAERLIHRILVDALGPDGRGRVEAQLAPWADTGVAMLTWLRQAPQSPAPRNLLGVVDRLEALRGIAVDRSLQKQIPEAAFERLAAEGVRTTVQHLRDLSQVRRHALLAVTAIRMEATLTDAALGMFDKLMGSLSRRAENRTAEKTLKSVRETQGQLRTLVAACRTLIDAREGGHDPFEALDKTIGWYKFVASVGDAETLAQPDTTDPRAELLGRYATVRAFAPALLSTFQFKGGPAVGSLLRSLEALRTMHASGKRSLPAKPPTGFIRRSWRRLVMPGGVIDRKAYEICALSELRDRLRAGDIWVEGSRQFRDFESCLVPRPTFDALREEGALPVAVEKDGAAYLTARRRVLTNRLAKVAGLAAAGKLEDVDLSTGELKVSPIRDRTPEAAAELGRSAYAALPRIKITDLLLEVDGWMGFRRASPTSATGGRRTTGRRCSRPSSPTASISG